MNRTWLITAWLVLTACGSTTGLDRGQQMIGTVVDVGQGLIGAPSDERLQIQVKSDPAEECGIIFAVDSDTRISDLRSGFPSRSGEDVLSEGAIVEVGFGLVHESCPGQSYAEAVSRLR